MSAPLVGVVMGSRSDWETMEEAAVVLEALGVLHEVRVVSAHRTPDLLYEYAAGAEGRGLEVLVAGAGGAAHLPGMLAAKTVLPVLGVPIESRSLGGLDSLLSIVQMPGGVPVGTLAIGRSGAANAAHFALFADFGDAYLRENAALGINPRYDRPLLGVGAELRGEFVIGYYLPVTGRLGYGIIVTNRGRIAGLTDPLIGQDARNGVLILEVGTSF